MIYLDSCALVKLILDEPETLALQRHLDQHSHDVITSELALTEVVRVARRSCYNTQGRLKVSRSALNRKVASASSLLDPIYQITVDRDACLRAGLFIDDPHLGSLDAIHLVCALEMRSKLKSFVTYDKVLARVATELGLPVEQPV